MKSDPRRALLELPQLGAISEGAIRAAYWRIVGRAGLARDCGGRDLGILREAKRALLFEAGVRLPTKRPVPPRG